MQIETVPIHNATQHISEDFLKRFWSKVPYRGEGCWPWTGNLDNWGYGRITIWPFGMIVASRASWILHHGLIPEGLCVLHHCDNPPCVRPDHLWIGTHMDNQRDMIAKGRKRTYVERGQVHKNAKLDEETVRKILEAASNLDLSKRGWRPILCKSFGITAANATAIVRRRTWKWLSRATVTHPQAEPPCIACPDTQGQSH